MTEKKVIGARLEQKEIDELNELCKAFGMSQGECIAHCVNIAKKNRKRLRSGGLNVAVMNPQFTAYTPEQAQEIVEILSEAAAKLAKVNPAADFGMHEIAKYAGERFFRDTDEHRKEFKRVFEEV